MITEHTEELLDNIVYYLLYKLKNEQAAKHLLDEIEEVYERMEMNPYQFAVCRDNYLAGKNYREALIPQMDYVIIFKICENTVYVLGIFHQLESYGKKVNSISAVVLKPD